MQTPAELVKFVGTGVLIILSVPGAMVIFRLAMFLGATNKLIGDLDASVKVASQTMSEFVEEVREAREEHNLRISIVEDRLGIAPTYQGAERRRGERRHGDSSL